MNNQIAITSDVDWAPEPVLDYMIGLFEERRIKCTFFCTHHSDRLLNADNDLFELAVHPNFNPLLQGRVGTAEQVLNEILALYPQAKGIRSHSMLQSTGLINLFAGKGLQYESNLFLAYHKKVEPVVLWNGLVRIPYNWEDDMHWMYNNTFDDLKMDMETPGLKIFDFHPIHIYLNTTDEAHYLRAKPHYQETAELEKHRNDGKVRPGAKDALLKVLDEIERLGIEPVFMREIADDFLTPH